jgi:hypothetical protein
MEDSNNSLNGRGADFLEERSKRRPPRDKTTWPEFALLTRKLAERLREASQNEPDREKQQRDPWIKEGRDRSIRALTSWANSLERAIAVHRDKQVATKVSIKRRPSKVQDGGKRNEHGS